MNKVILVLVLTLGGSTSALAGACLANPLFGSSCAATVDGTTFTVSLINITSASLSNTLNVNVTANSATPGTDTFTVQVNGTSPLTSGVGLNYGAAVTGNAGAAVTSVSTMFEGRAAGATLSTDVTPTGGSSLGAWNLTSSTMTNASGSYSTPSFVSAEVNTGLNLPSGLSLVGFTETFTVIWTAAPSTASPGVNPLADPLVAPEPTSIGLVAFAGFVGALLVRRRSSNK